MDEHLGRLGVPAGGCYARFWHRGCSRRRSGGGACGGILADNAVAGGYRRSGWCSDGAHPELVGAASRASREHEIIIEPMHQPSLGEPAHRIQRVAVVAKLKLAGDLRRRPWERVAQQHVQDAVVAPLLADTGALELVVSNTLALAQGKFPSFLVRGGGATLTASPPFNGQCSL